MELAGAGISKSPSALSVNLTYGPFCFAQFWTISAVLFLAFLFIIQPEEQRPVKSVNWDSSPFNTTRTLFITMNPSDPKVLEQIHVLRTQVLFILFLSNSRIRNSVDDLAGWFRKCGTVCRCGWQDCGYREPSIVHKIFDGERQA